jgi:hypothetical protein
MKTCAGAWWTRRRPKAASSASTFSPSSSTLCFPCQITSRALRRRSLTICSRQAEPVCLILFSEKETGGGGRGGAVWHLLNTSYADLGTAWAESISSCGSEEGWSAASTRAGVCGRGLGPAHLPLPTGSVALTCPWLIYETRKHQLPELTDPRTTRHPHGCRQKAPLSRHRYTGAAVSDL